MTREIQYSMVLGVILILIIACSKTDNEINSDTDEELIFNSGFEGETVGFPANAHLDISGKDWSYPEPNDWDGLDGHPNVGDFTIQYEDGVATERYAVIGPDPVVPANHVLNFWLKTPNVFENGQRFKGRVQANLYNNTGLDEILIKGRCFLHSDFNILKEASMTFGWLTIFEFWNNPSWQNYDFPFRITVNIKKLDEAVGVPLRLGVHAQKLIDDSFRNVWSTDNTDFQLPVDTWFSYELYFKEGDQSSGRFYLSIKVDGVRNIVFDIHDFTHHPDDSSPDGLSHFNPMKLYTSAGLIDFVKSRDKVLQVYWDDFELWKGAKPER